jgi:hypothetical protein
VHPRCQHHILPAAQLRSTRSKVRNRQHVAALTCQRVAQQRSHHRTRLASLQQPQAAAQREGGKLLLQVAVGVGVAAAEHVQPTAGELDFEGQAVQSGSSGTAYAAAAASRARL